MVESGVHVAVLNRVGRPLQTKAKPFEAEVFTFYTLKHHPYLNNI